MLKIGITTVIIITIVFIFQNSNNNNAQVEQNMLLSNENRVELNEDIESIYKYDVDKGEIENEAEDEDENEDVLISTEKINLYDLDGKGKNYSFTYKGTSYTATYSKDNWHIVDSYKITDKKDIAIICQALIEVHPIHGRDMLSYRTVEDMVYEWTQHNIAYYILPEDNKWRKNAKDVDLDPADQGRSLAEMYESRTGKKFNIMDIK